MYMEITYNDLYMCMYVHLYIRTCIYIHVLMKSQVHRAPQSIKEKRKNHQKLQWHMHIPQTIYIHTDKKTAQQPRWLRKLKQFYTTASMYALSMACVHITVMSPLLAAPRPAEQVESKKLKVHFAMVYVCD